MGIYCLETDQWFGIKDKTSIEPALRMLERYQKIPFQHRDVATESEFNYFLRKFLQPGYKNYPVLYLGFHGYGPEDGYDAYLELEDGTEVTLEKLEEWIAGNLSGGIIHFGSCAVMSAHGNRWNSFLKDTGAIAVCGYREDVDWLEAAAFEVLMLGRLFQQTKFTKRSVNNFNLELRDMAPGLYERLDFRLVIKP